MNAKLSTSSTGRAMLGCLAALGVLHVSSNVRGQDKAPYPVISNNGVPEGYVLIEGDMLVPQGGVAGNYQVNLWPQGSPTVVPFRFDMDGMNGDDVSQVNQQAMLNAMAVWEAVADVDFRQCNPCNGDFIHIRDSTNDLCGSPPTPCNINSSQVGKQGGQQVINIVSWGARFVIAHELGHALGLLHEHSRADRNTFVQINCANIDLARLPDGCGDTNFVIEGAGDYGDYDFDSVMHYGRCAFSVNPAGCAATCPSGVGETITVLPPFDVVWQCGNIGQGDDTFIGQRLHLSRWDSLVMSFMYPFDNWRFLDNECGNHGVLCLFCYQNGSFFCPYVDDVTHAVQQTPEGGTLWVLSPGEYSVPVSLGKPMTIRAPLGAVLTQ